MTEESATTDETSTDEPNFDIDPNDADELRMTETVQARNRKRVLIPLALLLLLFTVLSFLGPQTEDGSKSTPDPVEQKKP